MLAGGPWWPGAWVGPCECCWFGGWLLGPGCEEGLDCHCWGDNGVPGPLIEGEEGGLAPMGLLLLLCDRP